MFTSWKTTAAGGALIAGAVADLLTQFATGQWDGTRLMADWTALTGGIGLIVAQDSTKS